MDPAEAGEWAATRPKQLVFLTGLDPSNKRPHATLVSTFTTRGPERLPLTLRPIYGELDLPQKREKTVHRGILRRDWPTKYLERVPSLIVLFLDLDWDHPSWAEKKTEAESKCASIRASCRQGSRLAVVLLQDKHHPTPADDPLATERAQELCQTCQLTPKQLFVVPTLGDLLGYVIKLETAFHELAQGFYQQKLKTIRARAIPNNSPALVVRQLFKQAFLSELRLDTHTALRNYRLAYEQCKENVGHWDANDIFEWRSVVGLLNYKMCELCFLHSMAVEAINQMRKHQTNFFSSPIGTYPTPPLASIEHQLWKAKQCWHFAQLFEQAVVNGLTALATLNPGTHLDMAASIYSAVNRDIAALKAATPVLSPYPTPDPMANETVFFGQRPWRVGCDGLAAPHVEADAVSAIIQRLVVNHEGVISLLNGAMAQFKRYNCFRLQRKVMSETADVYYMNHDCAKALQLWSIVVREGVPASVRANILQKACWAAYSIASIKDFVWCAVQLLPDHVALAEGIQELLKGTKPPLPLESCSLSEEQIAIYDAAWSRVLSERQYFNVAIGKLDTFLGVSATFLKMDPADTAEKVPILVEISSSSALPMAFSNISVHIESAVPVARKNKEEFVGPVLEKKGVIISAQGKLRFILELDLSLYKFEEGEKLVASKIIFDLGDRRGLVFGQIEYDLLNSVRPKNNPVGAMFLKLSSSSGGISVESGSSVDCLVGEVAETKLVLTNSSHKSFSDLRLEFKRNEQASTAAHAVLFVDSANELKSDFVLECIKSLDPQQSVTVPLRFSAQLVGDMELMLEASYASPTGNARRSCKVPLVISACEPFDVTSNVLTMNGIPIAALLNHSEHIVKADVASNADIVITKIDWLLADVVSTVGIDDQDGKEIEEELGKDEVISFCRAVSVVIPEEEAEAPLGRIAIEWNRLGSSSSVRSIVALCRLPVLACPISVAVKVLDSPAIVRRPIRIQYSIYSRHKEAVELILSVEVSDSFMFCGDKKISCRLLPNGTRTLSVVVMPLSGGRILFPKISIRSTEIPDTVLQHCTRTLPATIFVLPQSRVLEEASDA